VNQVGVNRYRIAHAGEHDVMYYWYQSRRRVIAQEWLAKPLLAWDALATGRSEGALVRITLPDSGNGAGQAATGFAAAVLAEMQRSF
jgi:EpsI family protein